MKGNQINGDIEWDLEEQIFLLEIDRERATNWTMGTQILILSVREGVVTAFVGTPMMRTSMSALAGLAKD